MATWSFTEEKPPSVVFETPKAKAFKILSTGEIVPVEKDPTETETEERIVGFDWATGKFEVIITKILP